MKATPPRISVLITAFGPQPFLKEALTSILKQTFRDFEIILVTDEAASTTQSWLQGNGIFDERIFLTPHLSGKSLFEFLNVGLSQCRGEYIARMDADDVSLPTRLETQLRFLDNHPKVDVLGSAILIFGGDSKAQLAISPTTNGAIRAKLIFRCPLSHPSLMLRAKTLRDFSIHYPTDFPRAEDYALWTDHLHQLHFAALKEPLLKWRRHAESVGIKYSEAQIFQTTQIHARLLKRMGIDPSPMQLEVHRRLAYSQFLVDADFLEDTHRWLMTLFEHTQRHPWFESYELKRLFSKIWTEACWAATELGLPTYRTYKNSPFAESFLSSQFHRRSQLLLKSLLHRRSSWNERGWKGALQTTPPD